MRVVYVLLILCILESGFLLFFHPHAVEAAWYDEGYAYRKLITFTHNAALTNQSMRLSVDTSTATGIGNNMQSDCDDTRFTDLNGKKLRFKLVSGCSTSTTLYDVVFPTVVNGSNTAYLYYGNPTALSASDGTIPDGTTPSGSTTFGSQEKGISPAVWWKMDEGNGSTLHDATSTGLNATLGSTSGTTIKLRQEINIINKDTALNGDDSAIVLLDTNKFSGTVTYAFETIANATTGTMTVALERVGTSTQDATISVTSTTLTRQRVSFTPPAGQTEYNVNVNATALAKVVAARILVFQEQSSITATESQIEIGTNNSTNSTTPIVSKGYWNYTAANWDPTPSFYVEATYKNSGTAQQFNTTYDVAGTQSWQAPAGITSVDVELWGGGGGGGGGTSTSTPGGSGGGGGAYAKSTVSVTPGNSYTVVVGSAGTGTTGAGGNGGNSTFNTSTVIAEGGKGGAINGGTAGVGGGTTVSVGDIEYNGGTGFQTTSTTGGGGGGSAGPTSAGFPATSSAGAFATTNGGPGGYGQATGVDGGVPANGPGGGGGGGGRRSGGSSRGGAGWDGQAKISYSIPVNPIIKLQVDDGALANWTDVTNGTLTTPATTTVSRVRTTSAFTPITGRNYRLVYYMDNNTYNITLYNAKIVAVSSGTITKIESQYIPRYSESTASGTRDAYIYYDPAEWSGVTNTYYHEANGQTGGLTDVKLQYDYTSTPVDITNSTLLDVPEIKRSSALTMPNSATHIGAYVTQNLTDTIYYTRIIDLVQITGGSTSTGPPSWKTKKDCLTDACLYFSGSNAAATATNAAQIDFDQGLASGVTFSAWIKANDAGEGSTGYVFSKGTNTYMRVGNLSNGKLDLLVKLDLATTDATVTVTGGLTQNKWHHVAFGYTDDTNDQVHVYIDGVLRGTSSTGGGSPAATDISNLLLGHDDSSAGTFHGYIDDFRIYNFERSVSQIKTIALQPTTAGEGASAIFGAQNQDFLNNGLVGYWKLDDNVSGNGQTVTDASGNGLNGTTDDGANNTGMSCTVNGKFAKGCDFDGTDDFINVPDNNTLDITDAVTLTAWINMDTLATGDAGIVRKDGGYGLRVINNGKIGGRGYQCTGVSSNQTITTGKWYFVAWTYDEKMNNIYLNGRLDGTATETCDIPTSISDAQIGLQSSNFDGKIDDVRIYNRVLSPQEISSLSDWAPGPVAYWNMDEHSGTTLQDKSGNNNSSTTWTGDTKYTTGKYGSGLQFDGNNDVVRIAESTTTDLGSTTDSYAVSAWFKTSTTGTFQSIVFKDTNSSPFSYPFRLEITDSNNLYFDISDATHSPFINPTGLTVTDGAWHYITGVRDVQSDTLYLYLDGALVGSTTDTTTATVANDVDISIGNGSTSYTGFDFNGQIDDVRIYNYARSPKQIVSDMNGGHTSVGSPIASALGHWKFDEGYGDTLNNAGSCGSTCNGTRTGSTKPLWHNQGKFQKALSYGGSNAYVAMGSDVSQFKITSDLSLSAWINLSNLSSQRDIICKYTGTTATSAYCLTVNTSGKLQMLLVNSTGPTVVTTTGSTTLATGNWYHVTGTFRSASDVTLYVNAKQDTKNTTSIPTTLQNPTTILNIGGENSGSNLMNGIIDEAKIYNYALSPDEVRAEYNQGKAQVMGVLSTESDGTATNSAGRAYCVPGDTSTCSAPVAEWKLDEKTGQTVNDTSGNGVNGTLGSNSSVASDDPEWAAGKIGSAVKFNGDTGEKYVNIPDHTNLDFSTGTSISISLWLYPTSFTFAGTDWGTVLIKGGSNGTLNANYSIQIPSGCSTTCQLAFYNEVTTGGLGYDVYETSSNVITLNSWNHVELTYTFGTGSSMKIYVNGKLASGSWQESGNQTTEVNNDPLWIGASNYTGGESVDEEITGKVDNVTIYNYIRTPAQVAWDYNRGGPVGWWKFDECTGTTAYDASGNGNNGTITPQASGNTAATNCTSGSSTDMWADGATGKYNSSIGFDGADDYVSLGDLSVIENQSQVSWSFWIKPTSLSILQCLFCKFNTGVTQASWAFQVGANTTDLRVYIAQSSTVIANGGVTQAGVLSNGQWQHIVAVFDGTQTGDSNRLKVFVNGKQQSLTFTGAIPSSTLASTSNAVINNSSDLSLAGPESQFDDLRIYNYPLTTEQIKLLYNQNFAVRYGPAEGNP